MSESDTPTRPDYACMVHPGPRRAGVWTPADKGYRTCSSCLDKLREQLKEIPARYRILNATPGGSGDYGTRGAPGFGSRSPASDHVIAMRDPRSGRTATCWRGQDKRFHQETEHPVLSVFTELDLIAWHIVESRGLDHGPDPTVADTARFIDNHLDWLTRQTDIADHAAVIGDLAQQLRPVTGEPGRRHIGHCPNTITDTEDQTRECGAKLYAPLGGDAIICRTCSREWPRAEWLRLGTMLNEAS